MQNVSIPENPSDVLRDCSERNMFYITKSEAKPVCVVSVSYTHLDVYKRQLVGHSILYIV